MMKLFTTALLVVGFVVLAGMPAFALDLNNEVCNNTQADCGVLEDNRLNSEGDSSLARNLINTAIFILGMVSVVMIVIGGLKYVTSQGDSAGIQSAKNTILYAIIGIIVALASFVIVQFAVTAFAGS